MPSGKRPISSRVSPYPRDMVRARELGISIGRLPSGPHGAITDVAGVAVGHATIIEGTAIRTGVTVILPARTNPGRDPVFAGCQRLNGNGELTGLEWLRDSGTLSSPVAITNTYSVGVVRDALAATGLTAGLPVVGETWDGPLNDVRGMHVRAEHLEHALASASAGPVPEGNVGGGTGMICHEFKGGIGTASRVVPPDSGGHTVGVLVQANHGRRSRFRVDGAPVGERIDESRIPLPSEDRSWPPMGSIIIVVATDAPLLPHQCNRLALRAGFGVARTGGVGEHSSGDLVLAFATGNDGLSVGESGEGGASVIPLTMFPDARINDLYDAVIEATEEAILNAILGAETMTGFNGASAHSLDADTLLDALERWDRRGV
jgi:D-aminopeptidase